MEGRTVFLIQSWHCFGYDFGEFYINHAHFFVLSLSLPLPPPPPPTPGARNHHFFVLFLMTLNLVCGWMLYNCVVCMSLPVISSNTYTDNDFDLLHTSVYRVWTCVYLHTDWSQRCVSTASDGLWETITELFTCSPWITYISIITLFHTAWASVTLGLQLYQVSSLFFSSCWQ